MHRRSYLALFGGGVAAFSGCLSGDDPPESPAPNGWFDGVSNYDGFEDRTGSDEVTVEVGAGENGYRFEPPAITVAPDTTVVFEWTGDGGGHNVEHPDGDWENPEGVVESDEHTYERSFSEPGTHRYRCWPHEGIGMKGAVFVDASAN